MTSSPPLLVVGHGTRSDAGTAEFRSFLNRLRRRAQDWLPAVFGGFIELASPSVTEAVDAMTAALGERREVGHRAPTAEREARPGPLDVVAVPLVLTAASHGKGDIPASLAREQRRHPGLRYRYGRPLGPHSVLQDIMAARIDHALAGTARETTFIVLAGRGSTDPDANAEVAKVARLLWEGRGYAGVEPSFISLTEPSVPRALEKVRRLGALRIVVAPYFLFPGVLPDRVTAQTREFAARHTGLDVAVAGLIGDCDELADLVLQRYDEAVHGDIRMNCDTCAYRIAMPGFTDKVGRAQTPHHHPDDAAHHGQPPGCTGDPSPEPLREVLR